MFVVHVSPVGVKDATVSLCTSSFVSSTVLTFGWAALLPEVAVGAGGVTSRVSADCAA